MSATRVFLISLFVAIQIGIAATTAVAQPQGSAALDYRSHSVGRAPGMSGPPNIIIIPLPPRPPAPAPSDDTEHQGLPIPNYFLEVKETAADSFEALYSTFADSYVFSEDAQGLIGLVIVEVKSTAVIAAAVQQRVGASGVKLLSLNNERVMTAIATVVAPVIIAEVGTSLVAAYAVNFWLGQTVKYSAQGLTWLMTFNPVHVAKPGQTFGPAPGPIRRRPFILMEPVKEGF